MLDCQQHCNQMPGKYSSRKWPVVSLAGRKRQRNRLDEEKQTCWRWSDGYPRSGKTSHGHHLSRRQHVVEYGNGRVQVHELLLHWLYVEHRKVPHVATAQLVFARNYLHSIPIQWTTRARGTLAYLKYEKERGPLKSQPFKDSKFTQNQIHARRPMYGNSFFTTFRKRQKFP